MPTIGSVDPFVGKSIYRTDDDFRIPPNNVIDLRHQFFRKPATILREHPDDRLFVVCSQIQLLREPTSAFGAIVNLRQHYDCRGHGDLTPQQQLQLQPTRLRMTLN